MKLLSPTPTLRALPRATLLSASSENKFLLAASSTTFFTPPFPRSLFLGPRCDGSSPAAHLRRPPNPPLPPIKFPKGPRPPHPRAPPPNRLYRTRAELPA